MGSRVSHMWWTGPAHVWLLSAWSCRCLIYVHSETETGKHLKLQIQHGNTNQKIWTKIYLVLTHWFFLMYTHLVKWCCILEIVRMKNVPTFSTTSQKFSILALSFSQFLVKLEYRPCSAFLYNFYWESFHLQSLRVWLEGPRFTIILRRTWCVGLGFCCIVMLRHPSSSHSQNLSPR